MASLFPFHFRSEAFSYRSRRRYSRCSIRFRTFNPRRQRGEQSTHTVGLAALWMPRATTDRSRHRGQDGPRRYPAATNRCRNNAAVIAPACGFEETLLRSATGLSSQRSYGRPQRQSPQRIVLRLAMPQQYVCPAVVVAEHRGQIRAERDAGRAGQSGAIDQQRRVTRRTIPRADRTTPAVLRRRCCRPPPSCPCACGSRRAAASQCRRSSSPRSQPAPRAAPAGPPP